MKHVETIIHYGSSLVSTSLLIEKHWKNTNGECWQLTNFNLNTNLRLATLLLVGYLKIEKPPATIAQPAKWP